MNRRHFMLSTAALAMLLNARVMGQAAPRRAGIVIGVDNSAGMPTLSAAVSGAVEFATFLRGEGFSVTEFLGDANRTVAVNDVLTEVRRLVDLASLDQLVIYFSGHGVNFNQNEHWFLSGGLPNEIVSMTRSVSLARHSGIPNVVFISDACRTPPLDFYSQQISGGTIFPPENPRPSDVEIDRFYATLPGQAAWELPRVDSQRKHGIFTTVFLEAYKQPDRNMIQQVGGVDVVPNRRLKSFLSREVPRRVQTVDLKLNQYPQSITESGLTTFVGKVATDATPTAGAPPEPTIAEVTDDRLEALGFAPNEAQPRGFTSAQLSAASVELGFVQVDSKIFAASENPESRRSFETNTGFNVYGANVAGVETSPPGLLQGVFTESDSPTRPMIVRLAPEVGSAMIRFADGSGTVVAILPQYIGTIVVASGGVASVTYELSENSNHFNGDPDMTRRLRELRASVSAAAQLGGFRFQGDRASREENAQLFADEVRQLKMFDPTLGVLAAYAYAEAGLESHVQSVRRFMRNDLRRVTHAAGEPAIFDVAMLAQDLRDVDTAELRWTVPLCPMLSFGWNYTFDVGLPEPVREAQRFLLPGLWTTFGREGMDIVESFARERDSGGIA